MFLCVFSSWKIFCLCHLLNSPVCKTHLLFRNWASRERVHLACLSVHCYFDWTSVPKKGECWGASQLGWHSHTGEDCDQSWLTIDSRWWRPPCVLLWRFHTCRRKSGQVFLQSLVARDRRFSSIVVTSSVVTDEVCRGGEVCRGELVCQKTFGRSDVGPNWLSLMLSCIQPSRWYCKICKAPFTRTRLRTSVRRYKAQKVVLLIPTTSTSNDARESLSRVLCVMRRQYPDVRVGAPEACDCSGFVSKHGWYMTLSATRVAWCVLWVGTSARWRHLCIVCVWLARGVVDWAGLKETRHLDSCEGPASFCGLGRVSRSEDFPLPCWRNAQLAFHPRFNSCASCSRKPRAHLGHSDASCCVTHWWVTCLWRGQRDILVEHLAPWKIFSCDVFAVVAFSSEENRNCFLGRQSSCSYLICLLRHTVRSGWSWSSARWFLQSLLIFLTDEVLATFSARSEVRGRRRVSHGYKKENLWWPHFLKDSKWNSPGWWNRPLPCWVRRSLIGKQPSPNVRQNTPTRKNSECKKRTCDSPVLIDRPMICVST